MAKKTKPESAEINEIAVDALQTEAEQTASDHGVPYVRDPYAQGKWKLHTPLGIWIGEVSAISWDSIMLNSCTWVRDEGRMQTAVMTGTLTEHDFVGNGVWIRRDMISIAIPWVHPLPRKGS